MTEFQVWIQQDNAGLFNIRYRMDRGRGLLQFRQADLKVSTPASSEGIRRGMDLEEVVDSRFLVLMPDAASTLYTFAELSPYALENLPINDWALLLTETVKGREAFVLLDDPATDEQPIPLEMRSSIQSRQREITLNEEVRRLTMELAVSQEQLSRFKQQSAQQGALIETLREQIKMLLAR